MAGAEFAGIVGAPWRVAGTLRPSCAVATTTDATISTARLARPVEAAAAILCPYRMAALAFIGSSGIVLRLYGHGAGTLLPREIKASAIGRVQRWALPRLVAL
jgi:hypothetical protein